MQTKRGGEDVPPEDRGDCFMACVASILEVPLEGLPSIHDEDRHWFDIAQESVAGHGYALVTAHQHIFPWGLGDLFWLAVVPSQNLTNGKGEPLPHLVVACNHEIAHDPCLGDRYAPGTEVADILRGGYVLVPLAPASPDNPETGDTP